MSRRYQAYSGYKVSGVEWLGEIPEHWNLVKLKHMAICQPSNVDKKTKDGEESIHLCNYTDVYYNDEITSDMKFMKASATSEQIKKFSLFKDDVIITKDSEDPNDIAIAAVVSEDLNSVICGYHLAMIRAKESNYGRYLKRVFDSAYAKSVFASTCNGMTRYGLGAYAINNALFPQPPEKEQTQIATFLDRETQKIDRLIEKQQQLIKLLQEKRQAVISHAVTKGLNPDVKMKDSGVEWLGEIPEHWNVSRLKYLTKLIIDGAHFTPTYVDEGVPFLRVTDLHNDVIDRDKVKYIPLDEHKQLIKRCKPEKGDLLLSKNGTIGLTKIVNWDWEFSIFVSLCLIRFDPRRLKGEYFSYIFQSDFIEEQLFHSSKKTSVTNLHLDKINELYFVVPPIQEQIKIVDFLSVSTKKIDCLIDQCNSAIQLSKERRTALISAAVTGKIDVRDIANG